MTHETPLTMTSQERDRLYVMRQVVDERLSQVAAAKHLSLSTRQVRRLLVQYRRYGDAGCSVATVRRQEITVLPMRWLR